MSKLKQEFWDFQDALGNTIILRGCPAASITQLEYLFQRLADELSDLGKPFEFAYSNSPAIKSICHSILSLNNVPLDNLSPLIIGHLCANPGHLFLINFVASDEATVDAVEGITRKQAIDQIEAALVVSKLVPSLTEARALTEQFTLEALQAKIEEYTDLIDPESEGNKRRRQQAKESQRNRAESVLSQYLTKQS